MTDWELRHSKQTIENSLYDITTVESANPFGDYLIAKIDDFEGTKFDNYNFGTRVDADGSDGVNDDLLILSGQTETTDSGTTDTYGGTINNSGTYSNAGTVENQANTDTTFTGFVVEARETDEQGADVLEVEAYTFDQFLRKNDVSNDQTGNTIAEALKDIIETDTPVSWNANLVNVGDDQELTLSLKDERVETALQILAFKSENEEFGANEDLEFFFRERERQHIDRGISNAQYFSYDIPERGKEAINEVEVRYNQGNESVVVDNPGQKLDLQDSLDLPDPGTQRARINRPEITDPKDAEDEGRRYIKYRNATLTGTVTTFGLYDADPFDTIDIEIADRGIDSEFIITQKELEWSRDQTRFTIVENRGFDDDFIVRLSEKTERLDLRDSDPDSQQDRITTTNIGVNLTPSADIAGASSDNSRFVNAGRNLVRDGWKGDGNLNISHVAIGTDGGGLSRSNNDLRNEVARTTVTENLVGSTQVEYSGAFTQTGIQEVGLFDSNDNLITRSVVDTAVDIDGTVTVTIDVSNDASVDRGVMTNAGQETIRDVIADNSPSLPTQYAYGSDTTPVSVSDTALGNQVYLTGLDEIILESVDSADAWETYADVSATDPFITENGDLELAQTSFAKEAEANATAINSDADASGGFDASVGNDSNGSLSWSFTTAYEIPAADFEIGIRYGTGDSPQNDHYEWRLDGESLGRDAIASLSGYNWSETFLSSGNLSPPSENIEPGQHTLTVEFVADDTDDFQLDVVVPYDTGDRFGGWSYTFDNTNDGSGGFLDGPENYPNIEVQFETTTTRRDVDFARVASVWDDVSNTQFIELANDGSTFIRTDNSQTATANFASLETDVDVRVGISRYGTTTGSTPLTGVNGQIIDSWELFANPDSVVGDGIGESNTRAIVPQSNLSIGDILTESGHLDSNDNLLTRSVFADVEITDRISNLISSETVTFRTQ